MPDNHKRDVHRRRKVPFSPLAAWLLCDPSENDLLETCVIGFAGAEVDLESIGRNGEYSHAHKSWGHRSVDLYIPFGLENPERLNHLRFRDVMCVRNGFNELCSVELIAGNRAQLQ